MLDDLEHLIKDLEKDGCTKVVVFQSANPEIFIAYGDIKLFEDISTNEVPRDKVKISRLEDVMQRISKLPQVTIAKVEGYARGIGHEFTLACDMRFASRGEAIFMQMEVGTGVVPCGGGCARLARQTGLGKALEIILSARDFGADEAERYGSINKALDPGEIGDYVENLGKRISKFPSKSIKACKRAIYASVNLPIKDALKEEAYQLHQAMSKTPALKRFEYLQSIDLDNDMKKQRDFEDVLIDLQEIK